MTATSGVIGDFLFAIGPAADRCVSALDGFDIRVEHGAHIATRGAVQRGAEGPVAWLALADLVAGKLADGCVALDAAPPQSQWRGRFVQVLWNEAERSLAALVDHFSTLPLYVLEREQTLLLATDLRLIARTPLCSRETDPVAIYHYVNFGYVPAPLTICRDIRRLQPGVRLGWRDGKVSQSHYFMPDYREDLHGSDATLAASLRENIVASVHDYRPPGERDWGCFLSGGTDSSSIVSILSSQDPSTQVKSFSIGFAEEGYDELGYAELVAKNCNAEAHTARVNRSEAVSLLEQVVAGYDQPFGDASAVPTFACADLAARARIETLVAGDGGDEIFGGNARYAKDQVMESFYRLPAPLKYLGRAIGGIAGKSSMLLLNRIHNFVERGSLPNPDRFYTDDSFGSDYFDELLHADFRAQVDRDASLEFMRGIYSMGNPAKPLHRIMRLDLMMAIAQNDLVKVHGACRAHGISARFPYLDPQLVAWTGRLPPHHKVRGLNKRYLFKQAMAGILPDAVLRKKKQGFGLPIAVWLRSDPHFQDTVRSVLFDTRTAQRGLFAAPAVEKLLNEHIKGKWDHAPGIWLLVVLELWLRKHLDAA